MTRTIQEIRVFISSPGDVAPERDALERVILQNLNPKLERFNIRLRPLRWEKDGRPTLGSSQENLFEQLGNYDFFVGIFWKRFGTPNDTHESGTESEFRDAYARWQEDNTRPVMMYFCERDATFSLDDDPDEINERVEQAQKVKAFRKELDSLGLFWTYTTVEEFEHLTDRHLFDAVMERVDNPDSVIPVPREPGAFARPAG